MARVNVIERTDDEVRVSDTRKYFRPAVETVSVPVTYAGKYIVLCAVVTDIEASEAQMDSLETSIEAIPGVHAAHVRIGPARIPHDRLPAGADLIARIGLEIDMIPTPV
jgi:hypothetical protein